MWRALALALLLANLGWFAWDRWLAPRAADAPGSPPAGATTAASPVPPFQLVSELPPAPPVPEREDGVMPAGDALREGAAEPILAAGMTSPSAAGAAPGAPAARCVTVGPFADLEAAAKVSTVLVGDGYAPRQRPADGQVKDGYLVRVGNLATVADQERVQRRLQRGGLDDAFAMEPQDGRYSVSVGIFRERRRAERRAQVVTQMGLAAEIQDRMRPGTVYWLDFDLKTESAAGLEGLGQGAGALQMLPCPTADAKG